MKNSQQKINDYRNTSYSFFDFSIEDKKKEFMREFSSQHPTAWNIYNHINIKGDSLNTRFRTLYYNKCVYCGISTQVIDSSNFEVDHVIPKSVLKLEQGYDKKKINGIGNLVNSCKLCNRSKWNFVCDSKNIVHLHPDKNKLHLIYNRNTDFSIEINQEYKNNHVIEEFYNILKLDNQLRRLDYLLMEMKDFCDIHEGEPIINDIQRLISKIENKRRINY